jgi:fused signal recognition particle receptor
VIWILLFGLVLVAAMAIVVIVVRRRAAVVPEPQEPRPAATAPPAAPLRTEGLGSRVRAIFGRGVSAETWRELEDVLLKADVGPRAAADLVARIRERYSDGADPGALLRDEIVAVLGDDAGLHLPAGRLGVVMVVGVNGSGKTTTIGKLAKRFADDGKKVSLAASDTFRAAAGEQLEVWAGRAGAHLVSQDRGADPGAVAFDAVRSATARGSDVLIVDTAGRLHTKVPLMDELGKVKRVVEKHGPVDEVLLVLDATTGQNGLAQARVFAEVVDVTGIVLTKLDGTAKGGIVVAVQRELGVPVKLVGLGEGADDLAPFDPGAFVDAMLG